MISLRNQRLHDLRIVKLSRVIQNQYRSYSYAASNSAILVGGRQNSGIPGSLVFMVPRDLQAAFSETWFR